MPSQTLESRVRFCCSATEVLGTLIKVFNSGSFCPYTSFPVGIRENVSNMHTHSQAEPGCGCKVPGRFPLLLQLMGHRATGQPSAGSRPLGLQLKAWHNLISHLQSLDRQLFHLQTGPLARPSFILPTLNNNPQSVSCCHHQGTPSSFTSSLYPKSHQPTQSFIQRQATLTEG